MSAPHPERQRVSEPTERDPATPSTPALSHALARIRGLLLDLDGVITPTAEVHMRAWADLFTAEFAARGVAPYTDADYFAHLDGKPRHDGVRDTLASRGIELPDGTPDDAAGLETVWGLGNRKNEAFARILHDEGVRPYPGSMALIEQAEALGVAMAVVTSSRNGRTVLEAAGLEGRFPVIVDGVRRAELGLAGKPAPDTYLRGADELGLPAASCAVVEDAVSGVAVGAGGDFGLIIGVDRGVGAEALRQAGADVVVGDLGELVEPLRASREHPDASARATGHGA